MDTPWHTPRSTSFASGIPSAGRDDGPRPSAWCPWICGAWTLALVTAVVLVAVPSASPSLAGMRYGAGSTVLWLGLTGVVAGFFSGLLGIGGALITVPALYLLLPSLGVPAERVPNVAAASSLAAMVPTALIAAWAQQRRRALDGRWFWRLAPGMACGAAAGALAALQLKGIVVALLYATLALYNAYGFLRAPRPRAETGRPSSTRLARAAAWTPGWAVGPLAAGLSACAGMGAGSLLTPYLHAQGLALRTAAATAGALNLSVALGGALTFVLMHSQAVSASAPDWESALLLACGAVLAAPGGVALAHRLPTLVFRRALGVVTLLSALVLLLRTLTV